MALIVGNTAPDFEAPSSLGRNVRLSAHRGHWVVLYFYPKSFTPGCTRQARLFRDNYDDLQQLGAEIIGVSTDDADTQCDFGTAMGAKFPIVSDASGEISRSYEVRRPILGLSKRVTYMIDPDGKIAAVFYHEFQVSKHLDDVLAFLKQRTTAPLGAKLA